MIPIRGHIPHPLAFLPLNNFSRSHTYNFIWAETDNILTDYTIRIKPRTTFIIQHGMGNWSTNQLRLGLLYRSSGLQLE